ncbi:caspase family protein [Streptomyces sp. DvalAA-19]|uniref:caspase family protein n=1 Tax=Streptomyces sp. DvalAA-19 TaxID=1839761 RepID=UPI00081B5BB9|nr:caspase family protein [Streptomyces sp. DvalAA-19]SCD99013.1 Caspase domain-containing protein [Streptomyces sp. DvalAA-19]
MSGGQGNPDDEKIAPSLSSALLIGGVNFPRSKFAPVPAAATNIDRLKRLFADTDVWGLGRGPHLSAETDMTRAEILEAIGASYRTSKPGGLYVLYFAGHGHYDGRTETLYLAPHDTGDVVTPQNSMVSVVDVFRTVAEEEERAERKLLILDCCFSGGAIDSVPAEASDADAERGWFVMSAAAKYEKARGDSGRETTFFTGALLTAIEGVSEHRPSLSAQWVFNTVDDILKNSPDADGTTLQRPQQSAATWADRPWLRNRLSVTPPPVPHAYSSPAAQPGSAQESAEHLRPDGFRVWPSPEPDFAGRVTELDDARRRFGQRVVLPVHGPRYAGKSAFVRQFLSSPGVKEAAPPGQPWLLMEMVILNPSAESPVLGALADALQLGLQDVDHAVIGGGDPRRQIVIDRLREHTRGHTLLLVIDCGRLGYDSNRIGDELDELLAHPYFRDTANIVISRVPVEVEGGQQLTQKTPVPLAELTDEEAAEFLTQLLASERIAVDGASVLRHIDDGRLRLPGELYRGASGYRATSASALGSASGTPGDDPEAVATALVEGTTPNLALTLSELGCSFAPVGDQPATPEPLALLAVWSLGDRLSLPRQVLEDPVVAVPTTTLRMLLDSRVLSADASGCLTLGQASEQALRTLLLSALTGPDNDPFSRPVLALKHMRRLIPAGLTESGDLDRRLAAAAKILFPTAATALDKVDDQTDSVFQAQLRAALGWIEDDAEKRLPALHEVVCDLVVAPRGDALYRPASKEAPLTAPEHTTKNTVAGPVEPPTEPVPVEVAVTTPTPHPLFQLYRAVANLTFAARPEGTVAEGGEMFVAAAMEVATALADCGPGQVTRPLLRSVDTLLDYFGKRLGLTVRLLPVRMQGTEQMHEDALRRGPGQAGRVTLAVSWFLNTAEALVDANRLDEAGDLVDRAHLLVTETLLQDDSPRNIQARLQMSSRVGRARSRLLTDTAECRRELVQVVGYAVAGLQIAYEQQEPLSLWSMRLLDAAVLLLNQSTDDEELDETRSMVMNALDASWGDRRTWPPTLCVTVARFLRKVHAWYADPAKTQRGAQEAVNLLEGLPLLARYNLGDRSSRELPAPRDPDAPPPSLHNKDAAAVLSALAQCYGFLARALRDNQKHGAARARRTKAADRALAAVELAPSAFAYSVWLRQVMDIWRTTARTSEAGGEAERRRKMCVRTIRTWLSQENDRSRFHGMLDLACLESEWISQGSLRGAAQAPGQDFLMAPAETQQREIERIYGERAHKLRDHRHRYGPSIELCAMQARLEREYRRWAGIMEYNVALQQRKEGRGPGPRTKVPVVDNSPVLALFEEAARRWPGDARLIAAEARFHRYVWNYEKAIELYEHLSRTAPNGEVRRMARLSAAEAMLAEVVYDPKRHSALDRLTAAQRHLSSVVGRNSRFSLAAVLGARVALRLNQPVRWEPIDEAFQTVVGGDYAGTVGRFLDRRHYGEERSPSRLGDLVRFTVRGGNRADNSGSSLFSDYLGDLEEMLPASVEISTDTESPAPASPADQDMGLDTSEFVGELLLTDFTSVQLLEDLGKLYLDRARDVEERWEREEGRPLEPASDTARTAAEYARRAYDCFDACRLLQEARGNESIVIKFERGRAVTLAARFLQNANPFPRTLMRGRRDQISLAVSLLLTARGHSVGGFNKVCSRAVSENNALQARLGLWRSAQPKPRPR